MKVKILTVCVGLLIAIAAPATQAQVGISFGFNTCGYPYYYQGCPAYWPPVGVYLGGGNWGGGRDYHGGRGGHGGHDGGGGRHR